MQRTIDDPAWWHSQEERAMAWINLWIRQIHAQPKGGARCEKVSGHSCLFKIPTTVGVLYFKACRCFPSRGHRTIFSSEVHLTQALAHTFPELLPEVIAIEPEHQWMLLRECGPLLLRGRPVFEVWSNVIQAFARMQIASLSFKSVLLQAGCANRCLHHLVSDFETVLNESEIWSQIRTSVREDLYQSLPLLHCLCEELASIPVPAGTLVHGDLHAGNIVLQQGHPVFLDWSDGCIAHPFFDAVIFLARAGKLSHEQGACHLLQDAYLTAWQSFASNAQLTQAIHLVEVLGCVHQVVSFKILVGQEEPWKQEMHDGLKYWVKTLLERLQPILSLSFSSKHP